MADEDEGFLSRWSKRKSVTRSDNGKQELQQTAKLAPELDPHANEADIEIALTNSSEPSQTEMLGEADFEDVDFDRLDKSSDYTRFIKANVPAAIQKRALRKLWTSDSVFEVLDGMNDYDEDFTGDGLAGKIFKTAHKVGRGFITDEDDKLPDDENTDEANEERNEEANEETSIEPQSAKAAGEEIIPKNDRLNAESDIEIIEPDDEGNIVG